MSASRPAGRSHPFAQLLGIQVESLGEGSATVTVHAGERHRNPNGVVHGGLLFALIDTGMGAATTSLLGPGERCASIEVHVRFLAPVTDGPLRAEVTTVQRGGRVAQLDAAVCDESGALVATGTGSFAISRSAAGS